MPAVLGDSQRSHCSAVGRASAGQRRQPHDRGDEDREQRQGAQRIATAREVVPDEDPAEVVQARQPAYQAQREQPAQPDRCRRRGLAALAPGADQQRAAHQQGLLQYQHRDRRDHEAAVAFGGIEQRLQLQVDRRPAACGLQAALPAGAQALELYARRNRAHGFGKAVLHLLGDQRIGTVRIDRHHDLLAAHHLAFEVGGQHRIAHDLAAQQRLLCRGFIAGHQRHGDARTGLGKAQRLARQAAAVQLHHGDRNALHHFIGIEPGVEETVQHGSADQQQQHADIAERRAQRADDTANERRLPRHAQRPPHLSGLRRPLARPAVASSNSTSVASASEHTMGRLCTTGAPIWNCSICSRA